ncbi:MAG TPA: copper amine oxidase N-terminal domain-containing protein [Armatimonadota bacterium]|jgi:hypothetical protein
MQTQNPWLLMAAIALASFASGALSTRASAVYHEANTHDNSRVAMVIPRGTVIPVTMDRSISSATNRSRDTFTVTVRSQQDGDNEFPLGTQIAGVITEVQQKTTEQPGMLDVTFRQVLLPDGQKMSIQGSLLSLDAKSVTQTPDGRIMARDTESRDRLQFIAIGTGAGLVVGKLTKNTLLGGVLGALAGYIYSERSAAKSVDVTVKAGTVFGIRLDRDLAVKVDHTYASARDTYRKGPHSYSYTTAEIAVTINGHAVAFGDTSPYGDDANVFIPLTPVMNAARIPFTYNERRNTVLVNTDQGELLLKIGQSYALLQGEREMLEAPAVVKNGEVFVTPNYLALATNMRVFWNANTRTVMLSYGAIPNMTPLTGQDITLTVKGQTVLLGTNRPFIVGEEVLIPLAPVLTAANVPYTYNERRQSVRVDTDDGALYLKIDNTYALLDGKQVMLETPAQVVDGQVYVPLHFLSLATGLTAKWNTREHTVRVN